MKTWKPIIGAAIAAIVGIAAIVTACNTEAEESRDRSNITEPNETITINETEYHITIKGGTGDTFTDTEWNNATTKIKAALVSAYSNKPVAEMPDAYYQGRFPVVFGQAGGVTVIVEAFTGIETDKSWKTSDDGKTLYINRTAVDTLSSLGNAIIAMGDAEATMGKAMPVNSTPSTMHRFSLCVLRELRASV